MKKIILALVVGVMIGAIPSVFAIAKLFSDVDQNQWYSDAVYSLTENGIIEGYDDDTFRPSNSVNRAELAVMLDRLLTHLENEKVRLGVLSKFGAFIVMQSYEGCINHNITTFEELTDGDLTLKQGEDGEFIWHSSDYQHYCEIDAKTGDMMTYYFMEF